MRSIPESTARSKTQNDKSRPVKASQGHLVVAVFGRSVELEREAPISRRGRAMGEFNFRRNGIPLGSFSRSELPLGAC